MEKELLQSGYQIYSSCDVIICREKRWKEIWVNRDLLLPRLRMLSMRISDYNSRTECHIAERDLKMLIKELEPK